MYTDNKACYDSFVSGLNKKDITSRLITRFNSRFSNILLGIMSSDRFNEAYSGVVLDSLRSDSYVGLAVMEIHYEQGVKGKNTKYIDIVNKGYLDTSITDRWLVASLDKLGYIVYKRYGFGYCLITEDDVIDSLPYLKDVATFDLVIDLCKTLYKYCPWLSMCKIVYDNNCGCYSLIPLGSRDSLVIGHDSLVSKVKDAFSSLMCSDDCGSLFYLVDTIFRGLSYKANRDIRYFVLDVRSLADKCSCSVDIRCSFYGNGHEAYVI